MVLPGLRHPLPVLPVPRMIRTHVPGGRVGYAGGRRGADPRPYERMSEAELASAMSMGDDDLRA